MKPYIRVFCNHLSLLDFPQPKGRRKFDCYAGLVCKRVKLEFVESPHARRPIRHTNSFTILLAMTGPMPLTSPDPRYFSIPTTVAGTRVS